MPAPLKHFRAGFVNSWSEYLTDRAFRLRAEAAAEHAEWIPILMEDCDHVLRTPYMPIGGPETVRRLMADDPEGTGAWDGAPLMCHRCAGMHKVPGASGQRILLRLKLADLYDSLAGDRRPTS